MNLLKKPGYLLAVIIVLTPVIYLVFSVPLSFSNFSNTMRSIGKTLGVAGMVLFSFTLFLNTRLKFTEELFFGLDKTYVAHHILGTTTFSFLIFHPLSLASQYLAVSFLATANFLLPSQLPTILGTIALLSMTFFLALTFFSRLKYQNWKFTHRFLGVAFAFAAAHVLLISSDVSSNSFLRIYIIAFIALGAGSYLYRTIFWKQVVKRHDYVVKEVKPLWNITEITLSPEARGVSFSPGQFAFVTFYSKTFSREPHPFTISSSSSKNDLVFSIKSLGDFTKDLKELKPGTKAKIEGPFGKFSIANYSSKNYLFIAGGIGITPFLSMLRDISDNPDHYDFENMDVYYSANIEKELVFLEELKKISKSLPKNKKLNIFPNTFEKKGYLTLENIKKNSKYLKDSEIFICGPLKMMYSMRKQLISDKIKKKNIHTEEFGLL